MLGPLCDGWHRFAIGGCMLFHNIDEIPAVREKVRAAAQVTRQALAEQLVHNPMEAMFTLKFEEFGRHHLEARTLNIIEQLNQSFTVMASLAAAEYLLDRFGNFGGLQLNPGTRRGRDIQSLNPQNVTIEAEVFTCGRSYFRRKLRNDTERFIGANAEHCFVFFYCPILYQGRPRQGRQYDLEQEYALTDQGPVIEIRALDRLEIL